MSRSGSDEACRCPSTGAKPKANPLCTCQQPAQSAWLRHGRRKRCQRDGFGGVQDGEALGQGQEAGLVTGPSSGQLVQRHSLLLVLGLMAAHMKE